MKKKKDKEKKNYFGKMITIIVLIIGLFAVYARFLGTKGLVVREYSVINSKIPESFNGFKIVHFTDLHYGTTIKNDELKKIVKKINELKPDLVVFTGDLVDRHYKIKDNEKEFLIKELNKLDSSIGMYSVRGNHDITDTYNSIITQTNFYEINNINKFIYYKGDTPVVLVGLDDYLEASQNMETAFNYVNEETSYYSILLAHEPDSLNKLKDKSVDLMLSGHSHNGQVRLPFIGSIYTPSGSKSYYDEKYIVKDTTLFISGGLGTSKYPIRAFNTPSFNFYRLYNK